MSKRKILSLLVLFGGIVFLVLVMGYASATSVLASRSSVAPDHPRISYLAPTSSVRGRVNDSVMQARGATLIRSWTMAQSISLAQRLDALIIDATLLDRMNPWDVAWLRTQFHDGVILVGLGVDDDLFAQRLGLDTFRVPAEANVPLGPTGYRLAYSLALGEPGDLQVFQLSDWINRLIRGELDDPAMTRIQNYAVRSYGGARGTLDSARDVDVLFIHLDLSIEGIYKTRSEYAARSQDTKR